MAGYQDMTFSVEQALRTQRALRDALGLGAEQFPLPAFIGMISDEIEQMRAAGRQDDDIAEIIRQSTGVTVSLEEIRRFYAPAEQRNRYVSDVSSNKGH